MREWKEVGGILMQDAGDNLLMRFLAFSKGGDRFKGLDKMLTPPEIYELYSELKSKIQRETYEKRCKYCKYYSVGFCKYPSGGVLGHDCRKEGNKYFEPKYQL